MDISAIEGQELSAVEFVGDYLRLRFDGPMLTLYAWPHVLLADFSLGFGEPEYRNALCAQIALSLREEELSGPEAGSYSEDGSGNSDEEF